MNQSKKYAAPPVGQISMQFNTHHHSLGIFHQERIQHTKRRTCTRKNRFVPPQNLAGVLCCSTRSLDVAEALLSP